VSQYKIICLGDLHFPFHHKRALSWALDVIKVEKPTHVIQMGDLFDQYSLSRFPRSQNVMTPAQEVAEARECSAEMWRIVKKYAPKAKCIQLIGNHDTRVKSRILEKLPELMGIVNFDALYKFPGVRTVASDLEEYLLYGMVFMHGYKSKLGDHAQHNRLPTIVGHSHRGGLWVGQDHKDGKALWELNCGYLGCERSVALTYRKQRWNNWTLGLGMIDQYGPRFIPWSGKKYVA